MTEASKTAEKTPSARAAHEIFDAIAAHISKYLACDQHQLTILSLWAAYTHCYEAFPTAVYLNVNSPEPQSGKTLCLNLLRQLAHNPSFFTGSSADSIMKYLLVEQNRLVDEQTNFDLTLFFDDCHHTFTDAERQPLVALLNSGTDSSVSYFSTPHAYSVFGPKAFAGNALLPKSLAQRCISITLRRKKPFDKLNRFHPDWDEPAADLLDDLTLWNSRNSEALARAAKSSPPRLPQGLIPREQASAEPLIHIADRIGGSWPDRARAAVKEIFRKTEGTIPTELLCDLRVLFYNRKDPEYLATKDILEALRQIEYRPWSGWGPNSGKRLGALLHPLGIHASLLQFKSDSGFRGYLFKNFQDAWERYVPPIDASNQTGNTSQTVCQTQSVTNKSNDSSHIHGKTESGPMSYPYGR